MLEEANCNIKGKSTSQLETQESKAYRLQEQGTKIIVKRKDVRFHENIDDEEKNTELFIINQFPQDKDKTSEIKIRQEIVRKEDNESTEEISENDDKIHNEEEGPKMKYVKLAPLSYHIIVLT